MINEDNAHFQALKKVSFDLGYGLDIVNDELVFTDLNKVGGMDLLTNSEAFQTALEAYEEAGPYKEIARAQSLGPCPKGISLYSKEGKRFVCVARAFDCITYAWYVRVKGSMPEFPTDSMEAVAELMHNLFNASVSAELSATILEVVKERTEENIPCKELTAFLEEHCKDGFRMMFSKTGPELSA